MIQVTEITELKKINDVAKKYGVTKRSLRYYEEIGLLKSIRIGPSGSRYFDSAAINRLEQILLLRSVQISINDISRMLLSDDTNAVFEVLNKRLNELDKQITELNRSREIIGSIIKIGKDMGINNLNIYQLLKEQIYTNKSDERMISMEKAYEGDIIRVEFGTDVIPLVSMGHNGLLSKIKEMRKMFESEISKEIPLIRVLDNWDFNKLQYKISIKGRTIVNNDLAPVPAQNRVSEIISRLEEVIRSNIDAI